jgi:hypothetical protein
VESDGPRRLGQLFAHEEGIDLNERLAGRVATEKEATGQLREWQQEIPEVKSAYQPSGALSAGAVLFLLLGSLLSGVAGLVAIALLGSVTVALAAVLPFPGPFPGAIGHLYVPFVLCICAAPLLAASYVIGRVSAGCTTRLGERGQNRNLRAAVLFSVLGSILPVVVAWSCYYHYLGSALMLENRAIRLPVALGLLSFLVVHFSAIVGLVIAPIVAGRAAAKRVRSAMFCEGCHSFMRVIGPKYLSLGCLRALALALRKGKIDVVGSLLYGPSGREGQVRLYACRSCLRGYLEVLATYHAEWVGEVYAYHSRSTQTLCLDKTWIAGSSELAAAEVQRLLAPPGQRTS